MCIYVFFILIWRILALYIKYGLAKVINIFSLWNLVDNAVQENATGIGNNKEGALLNENICDSQSKTGAFEEKNSWTESSVFDLADVITGCKLFEKKYYYLTKHYCPKDQNSSFKKQCIKGGETKNLTYQILWIQNKPWHVYSKDFWGCLWKVWVLFQIETSWNQRWNMTTKSTIKTH